MCCNVYVLHSVYVCIVCVRRPGGGNASARHRAGNGIVFNVCMCACDHYLYLHDLLLLHLILPYTRARRHANNYRVFLYRVPRFIPLCFGLYLRIPLCFASIKPALSICTCHSNCLLARVLALRLLSAALKQSGHHEY
jgi:hypothetical protein